MKSHALHLKRSFSHDVTEAILVYKTITRRLCWCTKNFSRDWTNFACKFFLLLQEMIIVAEVKTIYQAKCRVRLAWLIKCLLCTLRYSRLLPALDGTSDFHSRPATADI